MERGNADTSLSHGLPQSFHTRGWWRENNVIKVPFYLALFVQEVQDTQLGLNQINARLVVVEVNQCPGDLFFHVFLLLQFENMLEGDISEHDLCVHFL